MNKVIYYLSTCDTCKRIMGQIDDLAAFEQIDIKKNPVTADQLADIASKSGLSHEELFNKRARKYKEVKRDDMTDEDFRDLILTDYTFIKRPVIMTDENIYVGNSKKVVEAAIAEING